LCHVKTVIAKYILSCSFWHACPFYNCLLRLLSLQAWQILFTNGALLCYRWSRCTVVLQVITVHCCVTGDHITYFHCYRNYKGKVVPVPTMKACGGVEV
jgi:hypothetical protein